jgi:hypothetical protein
MAGVLTVPFTTRRWMERYFDAFLYLANWGTHRIALRLPVGVRNPPKIR